jgi:hypothetical protein
MDMDNLPEPPPPPSAPRRVRLYPFQWFGAAALALLPMMAVAGVFGETWAEATAETPSLEVRVSYPSRFRYKQLNQIEVWVRNRSGAPIDTITVSLDSAYARQFSTINAIPPFSRAFGIPLTDVLPNETRLVIIEVQAERYGRHKGAVRTAAVDTATIALSTIVFP